MARATCPSLKIWATSLPQNHSRRTAQAVIARGTPLMAVPSYTVTGPGSRGQAGESPGSGDDRSPHGHKSALAISASNPGPTTTSRNNPLADLETARGLSYAVAWCGAVVPCRPGCRSRPCALLLGGDDVPVSRVGKDEPPRPRRLGPHAAAHSRAAVPRAAVRRAAVPPVAARARHRPVPVGGPGWWRSR